MPTMFAIRHEEASGSDGNNNQFSSAESSPPALEHNLDDLAFKISMMGLQGASSADPHIGGK